MKIAIDISQIVYGTGVSSYTKNIVTNLLQMDQKNEYVLYGGSLRRQIDIRKIFHDVKGNYKLKLSRISPTIADLLWNRIHSLNIESVIGNVDVFHSSDWTEPPSNAFKVTTIHDLSPILYPNYTSQKIKEVFERKLHWVKKETDKIIAPTQTTKQDLIDLGFDESRIEVIYEGLDPFFTIPPMSKKEDYILAVGAAPRKNLDNIILAFKKLKKEGLVEKLLVIGQKPDHLDTEVRYIGPVSNLELKNYYAKAKALVYASFYEGFGLPILEAYSQSCPVVTSDIGSMKEVSGNASVLVNPKDFDDISDGIKKAIKSQKRLVALGHERLKIFSWEKAAEQTLRIYEQKK